MISFSLRMHVFWSRHGTFSTKLRIPFNIFAMAEVAMDVPNYWYYTEQEAPLTLRGQRGSCRNIKGEPNIWELP